MQSPTGAVHARDSAAVLATGTSAALLPVMTDTMKTDAMALSLHTLIVWSGQDTIDDRMLRLAMSAWAFIVNWDDIDGKRIEAACALIADRLLGPGWTYAQAGECAISADRTRAIDFTCDGFPKSMGAEDLAMLVADIEEEERNTSVTLDKHYCDADGARIEE